MLRQILTLSVVAGLMGCQLSWANGGDVIMPDQDPFYTTPVTVDTDMAGVGLAAETPMIDELDVFWEPVVVESADPQRAIDAPAVDADPIF